MNAILAVIAIGLVMIFLLGILFSVLINHDTAGPLFILPLFVAIAFGLTIISNVYDETVPIDSASVHQAVVLCETNGGLKTLDQREAVCENGVAFNTRSLKQPEKQ